MTFLDPPAITANSSPVVAPESRLRHELGAGMARCRTSHDHHQYRDSWGRRVWVSPRTSCSGGGVVSSDPDFTTIVELLSDTHVRTILSATSVEPYSASELVERCDASDQTIYRRLERLEEAELVSDQIRARGDGHHDTVYTAKLEHVSITLHDGEFEFSLEQTQSDPVDELTDLWGKF